MRVRVDESRGGSFIETSGAVPQRRINGDAVAAKVYHEEASARIQRDELRVIEQSASAADGRSGHAGARRIYRDAIAIEVRDVDVRATIDSNSLRFIQAAAGTGDGCDRRFIESTGTASERRIFGHAAKA